MQVVQVRQERLAVQAQEEHSAGPEAMEVREILVPMEILAQLVVQARAEHSVIRVIRVAQETQETQEAPVVQVILVVWEAPEIREQRAVMPLLQLIIQPGLGQETLDIALITL